jgi:hypothetical protein
MAKNIDTSNLPFQPFEGFILETVQDFLIKFRDYVRGEAEGALAPPEFEGSERRTEGESDNPLIIAPSESKS